MTNLTKEGNKQKYTLKNERRCSTGKQENNRASSKVFRKIVGIGQRKLFRPDDKRGKTIADSQHILWCEEDFIVRFKCKKLSRRRSEQMHFL